MKDRILDWLTEKNDFVSGQHISQQLGVTRAAVWKVIKTLQEEGYPIIAVPRRGYKIAESADVLTARQIKDCLQTAKLDPIIQNMVYKETVDSTNQMARKATEKEMTGNSLFIASRQRHGRGRRGRSWISDSTSGLWFTLLLQPEMQAARLSMLTLFTGLCVARALDNLGINVGLKWPNDIVAPDNGRKIGGILTEMMIEDNNVEAAIIGIGINVSSRSFPDELKEIATSLYMSGSIRLNRLEILREILQVFFARWPGYAANENWLEEYAGYSLTIGRPVRVLAADREILRGTACGLNEQGELIVEDRSGQQHTVCSGEVSVRGLLGE